jgi:hypothetical protein
MRAAAGACAGALGGSHIGSIAVPGFRTAGAGAAALGSIGVDPPGSAAGDGLAGGLLTGRCGTDPVVAAGPDARGATRWPIRCPAIGSAAAGGVRAAPAASPG